MECTHCGCFQFGIIHENGSDLSFILTLNTRFIIFFPFSIEKTMKSIPKICKLFGLQGNKYTERCKLSRISENERHNMHVIRYNYPCSLRMRRRNRKTITWWNAARMNVNICKWIQIQYIYNLYTYCLLAFDLCIERNLCGFVKEFLSQKCIVRKLLFTKCVNLSQFRKMKQYDSPRFIRWSKMDHDFHHMDERLQFYPTYKSDLAGCACA